MGVFQYYLFGGPYYKDSNILGSILGPPIFWERTTCSRKSRPQIVSVQSGSKRFSKQGALRHARHVCGLPRDKWGPYSWFFHAKRSTESHSGFLRAWVEGLELGIKGSRVVPLRSYP